MPTGLDIKKLTDLGGGAHLIGARPSSASEAVLGLLTGPLKTFSDKVDAVLADQNRRISALEKALADLKRAPKLERRAKRAHR